MNFDYVAQDVEGNHQCGRVAASDRRTAVRLLGTRGLHVLQMTSSPSGASFPSIPRPLVGEPDPFLIINPGGLIPRPLVEEPGPFLIINPGGLIPAPGVPSAPPAPPLTLALDLSPFITPVSPRQAPPPPIAPQNDLAPTLRVPLSPSPIAPPIAPRNDPAPTLRVPPPPLPEQKYASPPDCTLKVAANASSGPDSSGERTGFGLAISEELSSALADLGGTPPVDRITSSDDRVRPANLQYAPRVAFRAVGQYVPPAASGVKRRLEQISAHLCGAERMVEMAVSFRELSIMLEAGIQIVHGAELLSTTLRDPLLRQTWRDAMKALEGGASLSQGLRKHQHLFPGASIELIRIGERSGRLQEVLARLAQLQEEQNALTMRVRSALAYPALVFVVGLAVIALVPALLFDGMFALMQSTNADVSLPTRALMLASKLMRHPLTYVAACGVLGMLLYSYGELMNRPSLRRRRDELLLKVPGFGPCLRFVCLVRFAQTLSALYGSGAPLLMALRWSGQATGNVVYEDLGLELSHKVSAGIALHDAMRVVGGFPRSMVQLVAAGDETGYVGEMLGYAAELGQQEVDARIQRALAALEPALVMFMGAMVACIVIATLSPLMNVLERLQL